MDIGILEYEDNDDTKSDSSYNFDQSSGYDGDDEVHSTFTLTHPARRVHAWNFWLPRVTLNVRMLLNISQRKMSMTINTSQKTITQQTAMSLADTELSLFFNFLTRKEPTKILRQTRQAIREKAQDLLSAPVTK
ncbi:predicted protein [Coccidioides posadasii str. Silveira]|uniref:Predicted protein n=1 Tax=Coccidioides posadasii (strain RMSCC 757 / Silveira) TaxID=443226 RepID=E9DHK1_COCPS|nr:predicted protein [Coccidioides posadasii str. Silveira]